MQTYHKLIKTAGEWTLSPGTESFHRVLILPPTPPQGPTQAPSWRRRCPKPVRAPTPPTHPRPKAVAAAAGIDIDLTAETIMGLAKHTWCHSKRKSDCIGWPRCNRMWAWIMLLCNTEILITWILIFMILISATNTIHRLNNFHKTSSYSYYYCLIFRFVIHSTTTAQPLQKQSNAISNTVHKPFVNIPNT